MSSSTLRKLQEWLTIDEAATELAEAMSEPVTTANILRLGIDGRLKLSVYLPTKVTARCQRIKDDSLDPSETDRKIEGLCDLPMFGRGKMQVEHDYQWVTRGKIVPLGEPVGAFVEQGDFLCKLPPDRGGTGLSTRAAKEFSQGSVLCVRRAER